MKPLSIDPWTQTPGAPILEHPYGLPSPHESNVIRRAARAWPMPGAASSLTPLADLLIGDKLIGGAGTLASATPKRTVGSYWPYATTLFDYIRRAMPYNAPQSLSADEVYALSAWILNRNGIVPDDAHLDAHSLAAIRMPNRDGFVPDPRPGTL
ncbi:c-type cytochrome [Paraburkholderia sp. BR13439]|uniref:c-type cytochrome n=1 Tax=Paraburkholderia sp. BR13439 TaxID=3236996 RepID=UPI0034CF3B46